MGVLVLVAVAIGGCEYFNQRSLTKKVPYPLSLTLPKSIRIHPFTATRVLDERGGVAGIDAQVQALDTFGDATKAFGDFRFELYEHVPNSVNSKGELITTWEIPVLRAKDNILHWDDMTRSYQFKLKWDQPIPAGQQFVLVAVFTSRFTERLFDERVFVSGE